MANIQSTVTPKLTKNNMIDFHSHILPQMDDGSSSTGESLQMLKASFAMGIDTIISTPHYYFAHETIDDFLKRRSEKHRLLLNDLQQAEDVPEIIQGAEVAYFSGMSREKEIGLLCIENTKYLLLEMPYYRWTSLYINEIKGLIASRGITPIIAHVDRYLDFLQSDAKIEELLSLGAVFQVNCDALLNKAQRRIILKMLHKNQLHILGTDCHNMSDRAPNLDPAVKIISKKLGPCSLEKINLNGRRILNDECI